MELVNELLFEKRRKRKRVSNVGVNKQLYRNGDGERNKKSLLQYKL